MPNCFMGPGEQAVASRELHTESLLVNNPGWSTYAVTKTVKKTHHRFGG